MPAITTQRRKGAAAVEFAFCLFPLLIIVIGIFEGGRVMMVEEQLASATREGARLASLGGSTIGTSTSTGPYEVNYRVRQSLAVAHVSSGLTMTVTDLDNPNVTDLTQAAAGDRIEVAVAVPFTQVAWCPPWFFGGATLSAACIARKESP